MGGLPEECFALRQPRAWQSAWHVEWLLWPAVCDSPEHGAAWRAVAVVKRRSARTQRETPRLQMARQGRGLLKFVKRKAKALRAGQNIREGEYVLMRALPILHDRVAEFAAGTLSEEGFPWLVPPPSGRHDVLAPGMPAGAGAAVASARSVRGPHSVGWSARVKQREAEEASRGSSHARVSV